MLRSETVEEYLSHNGASGNVQVLFQLVDKGSGNEVYEWNTDIPQPTEQDLQSAQARLDDRARKKEIRARLQEIDVESVRPIRAKSTGQDKQADRDRLDSLENEAQSLRDEMATLSE